MWLENPWVIGIGGGVASGFLVNWISRSLLSKKEDREYLQKIHSANNEMVYSLRPGISESQMPTAEILVALRNATARRYKVEASDLFSPGQLTEELIKEVMDSSFISASQKTEYCGRLSALVSEPPSRARHEGALNISGVASMKRGDSTVVLAEYRSRQVAMTSTLLGFVTATSAIMFSALEIFRKGTFHLPQNQIGKSLLPAMAAVVSIATATLASAIFIMLNRRARISASVERSRLKKSLGRSKKKNADEDNSIIQSDPPPEY